MGLMAPTVAAAAELSQYSVATSAQREAARPSPAAVADPATGLLIHL